jgi:hypothetical protein
VDAVLTEITSEALARKIGIPIDSARASYVMGDVLVDSADEFYEVVSGFYLTLLRHRGMAPASVDHAALTAEALHLLEAAFRREGGSKGAQAEARDGTRGGMRFVLNMMTEQYKLEQQSNHAEAVIAAALDPLTFDERAAFMRALLDRMGPHLPADIRDAPPAQFARHYDTIAKAYVQSLDRVRQLLRTL